MAKVSLDKSKIKFLLLEGVHQNALDVLKAAGYTNIEYHKKALDGEELIEAIKDAHFVGIRSRTHLTKEILEHAQKSVAELVLAEIILLMRQVPKANMEVHRGVWNKSAAGANEVRGKKLGIIGYGHIGSQLSVIAEAVGMQVYFYDIENKLPLGNAQQVASLDELLSSCDAISLHVPENASTKNLMNAERIAQLKDDAILINAARGTVVDLDALATRLEANSLRGAAIDVFPVEPASINDPFESPLRKFDNVILTPHIGGSTVEAQENIGTEVANKFVKYSDNGSTLSAVNFPEVSLPANNNAKRLLHIHQNKPGILNKINQVFVDQNVNIAGQYLQTDPEIGYVVIDVQLEDSSEALKRLKEIDGTIKARVLY